MVAIRELVREWSMPTVATSDGTGKAGPSLSGSSPFQTTHEGNEVVVFDAEEKSGVVLVFVQPQRDREEAIVAVEAEP